MTNLIICIPSMRRVGRVSRVESNNAYRLLVGRPEGVRPLGRLCLDEGIIFKCD